MKVLHFIIIISIILFTISCKQTGRNAEDAAAIAKTSTEPVKAVCIIQGVPIREEPRKDGKWISSMELGETVSYLGESVSDTSEKVRTFYRVELSDGNKVWARSYGILIDAGPAAVIENSPIYKRPDLVTKTDQDFFISEFVAIVDTKDEWIKVVGAGKRKSGWIMKNAVTTEPEDIAISTLAYNKVIDKYGNIKVEKLSEFLDDIPYKEARLAKYFQDKLKEEVELAIEKSIEEYKESFEVEN
ncbi:MAG: hypothetical protein JW894_02105 [Bacteroidales bacterium]|nr:hypothetical protein [Bacteroidales bacterium]